MGAATVKGSEKVEVIRIAAPKFRVLTVRLVGASPYMQQRMSQKVIGILRNNMESGPTAKKGKKREARDFAADVKGALHVSTEGWIGIPAAALRNASIDVCRMVGFKMTHAKMSIFVEADGYDSVDGTPLVRLVAGPYEETVMPTRNQTGVVDLRARPMWREWSAVVRVRFDADQFSAEDVFNLLSRAGQQIGIGEGRAFSKESNGMGYGFFGVEIVNPE